MRLAVIWAVMLVAGSLTACVKMVSSNRMMSASPRPPDCSLELVQVDMLELSPMGTRWDYLGTVSIGANHVADAASEETRALIRPKACELGGTAVALMTNATSDINSAITYAVLRPKQAPSAPTTF